jgi:hypothetical protein
MRQTLRLSGILAVVLLALLFCTLPATAEDGNPPAAPPSETDDFNPGVGIAAAFVIMVVVVVLMLLLGMGLAVGLLLCALTGALVAVGILSSSVAIGFIRRNPAAGFRALFLQLGAVAGIPCGIAAAWVIALATHSPWSVTARIVVGGAVGLACGISVAWLFNFVWSKIAAWIVTPCTRRQQRADRR